MAGHLCRGERNYSSQPIRHSTSGYRPGECHIPTKRRICGEYSYPCRSTDQPTATGSSNSSDTWTGSIHSGDDCTSQHRVSQHRVSQIIEANAAVEAGRRC